MTRTKTNTWNKTKHAEQHDVTYVQKIKCFFFFIFYLYFISFNVEIFEILFVFILKIKE